MGKLVVNLAPRLWNCGLGYDQSILDILSQQNELCWLLYSFLYKCKDRIPSVCKLVSIETGRTERGGGVNLEPQLSRLWLAWLVLIIFKTHLRNSCDFLSWKKFYWIWPDDVVHTGASHTCRGRGNDFCHQERAGRHQVAIVAINIMIITIAITTTIIIGMIAIITIKYNTYFLGCMILRLIGIYKKPKKGGVN